MFLIKKKNIKIILWKKIFKINKNYIKNFKIVLEIKNLIKKKNLIIFNPLNSSHHCLGTYKNNIKNVGWWDKILKCFKDFKIINFCDINSSYGTTNYFSKNILNYKKNLFKTNYKNFIKIYINILKKIKIKKINISLGGSLGGIKNYIFYNLFYKNIEFLINIGSSNISLKNKIKNHNNKKILNIKELNYKEIFNNFKNIKNIKIVRKINNLDYISKFEIKKKRKKIINLEYKIKKYKKNVFKYIDYKSNKFIKYYSIKSYLSNIKINNEFLNIKKKITKKNKKNKTIFIYFKEDLKFNLKSFKNLIKLLLKLKNKISLKIINSNKGHDAFLIKNAEYLYFLNNLKLII
ncbi:MAG: hypothetical protein ACSHUF_00480 [Candidatus Nasuia deltocephalinicola]